MWQFFLQKTLFREGCPSKAQIFLPNANHFDFPFRLAG